MKLRYFVGYQIHDSINVLFGPSPSSSEVMIAAQRIENGAARDGLTLFSEPAEPRPIRSPADLDTLMPKPLMRWSEKLQNWEKVT